MDIQGELCVGKAPIVKIDFSKSKARNSDELINYIVYQLDKTAQLYEITLEQTQYDIKFDELLTKLSGINKCRTWDFIEAAYQLFDMIRHSLKVISRLYLIDNTKTK